MKKDLTIYGNLTIDRIYSNFGQQNQLGGIANCWRAISKIDSNISVNVHPLLIGEALIYIDKANNERISSSIVNKVTYPFKHYNSKIYHIAYIDQIADLSFIKSLDGIICADVCSSNFDNKIIKYIDYFFISDEDLKEDIKFYGSLAKVGAIVHYPNGSIFSDGKVINQFYIDKKDYIENINVLGAGDIFASAFISQIYKKENLENSIKKAHILTSKILRGINEKI